ncbi:MAG: site-specific integrase, partial [Oscillospiraceae bacterium]
FKKMAEYREEDSTGPKFSTVAEEWYTAQEMRFENGKLSFNTLKGYSTAKVLAVEYFKDVRVKLMQSQDCERYAKYLASRYEGAHTVANKLSVLHLILDYCCINYNIPYNASDRTKSPEGLLRKVREVPPDSHIEKVKNDMPKQGTDEFIGWLFYYTALSTGARRGEMVPMRIGHEIDFVKNIVHITKSTYFNGNQPVEKTTKTFKGIRDVVLLDDFKKKLLELGYKNNDLLFTRNGEMLTLYRLKMCLKRYCAWAGIDSTLHQYRHGFITVCFDAGIEPKIIQEMAGHAQLSTTMDIYTHLRRHQLETAATKLNGIDFITGKLKACTEGRNA